jgi:branched-chain amino acid transport system permease protein
VLVVLLQVFLSDLTGAWMLYFGLIFILMVMFAPGGLAGLVMLHLPLWQRGTLLRVLPHYAAMAVPALMGPGGLVLLIETAHHQLVKTASEGPAMSMLGIGFNSNAAPPWIVALALLGAGIWLGRLYGPRLAAAFTDAAHGKSLGKEAAR